MTIFRTALSTTCLLALASCGTHNHAPVVYGDADGAEARIYHSPDDIKRKQDTERARAIPAAYAPAESRPAPQRAVLSEPIELQPVSAIYLDEPKKSGPVGPGPREARGFVEVQRGETVYALARRFNVSPQSIIEENDLVAPYHLTVGQAIKLPHGASVAGEPLLERKVVAAEATYIVKDGDTLFSISRASKTPLSRIAQINNLREPYNLRVGQRLRVPQASASELYASVTPPTRASASKVIQERSASRPEPRSVASSDAPINLTMREPESVQELARKASYTAPAASPLFEWPLRGAVVAEFGAGEFGRRNDGVNIAAPAGTPIRAAADGEVVYKGSELDGFGNLLLIKHTDGFVTAYAHNDAMLVRKGDKVRQGQVVAKVGQSGAVSSPQLHFEIRQNLKSINPVELLGPQ